MGCDIHEYLEELAETTRTIVRDGVAKVETNKRVMHRPCPDITRNYHLFALLAGVRSYSGTVPVVAPRGIPGDPSRHVLRQYHLQIDDEKDAQENDDTLPRWDEGHYCTEAQAKRYTEGGYCKTLGVTWGDHVERYVEHPDWHTPSWLTVAELEEVQRRYADSEDDGQKIGPCREIAILIAMMNAMNGEETDRSDYGGVTVESHTKYTSRFVFWFDN